MQSLGMDNFRVAFTRFLAVYSDNPSGLRDGETSAKWQSKASFASHPSTETEWPPTKKKTKKQKNKKKKKNTFDTIE